MENVTKQLIEILKNSQLIMNIVKVSRCKWKIWVFWRQTKYKSYNYFQLSFIIIKQFRKLFDPTSLSYIGTFPLFLENIF